MIAQNSLESINYSPRLNQMLEDIIASSGTHAIQMYLDSDLMGFRWEGALGYTARQAGDQCERLSINHPVRIASNTKTYVAAAVLRLWEEKQLSLDDSIERYISNAHARLIQSGGYLIKEITIRQLLTHTSGLADYADTPEFEAAIREAPNKDWSRTDQLVIAMQAGDSYGGPGEVFRYSDTGYILLGELIECLSTESLGRALRRLLNYEKIGLSSTWLAPLEDGPSHHLPFVHQYEGRLDYATVNPSCDIHGGGGLIATVPELAIFIRALFTGDVFKYPSTLMTLLSSVAAFRGGPAYNQTEQVPLRYRMGIEASPDGRIFSHKGHAGTLAAYIPEFDLAIALSINQARNGQQVDQREKLLSEALSLFGLQDYSKN